MIRLRSQEGFTVVEAVVAALVLVVGLLAAALMITISTHSNADVKAREGAVTLARQITEDARSIDYSQISSASIVSDLQAMPGLSSSSGSSWTIVRNGVTYTLTASVTTKNDPKDTSGSTDLKQVTTTVTWTTFQSKSHTYSETTTLSKAGQDPGLIASSLQLASASPVSVYSGTSTAPVITSSGTTALTFSVTAPSGTTAIDWSLNGGSQSSWDGSTPTTGTTWTSSAWSLSGVSDGTYTVGAQAVDSNGVSGPTVTISVRLIRNVPSAPGVTGDGFNSNFIVSGTPTTVAELQWSSNPELNIVGYGIYKGGTEICQTSISSFNSACSVNGGNAWCSSATSCVDLSQSSTSSSVTYQIKALYFDASNVLRAGTAQSVTLTSGTPAPPPAPPLVSESVVTQPDNTAILTWTPPVGGTAVSFYRIYRDGSNYTNRYDTVSASSCSVTCTYHDTGRTSTHSYYISSVGGTTAGSDMAESAVTGPVTG